jgi:hypothetical protein
MFEIASELSEVGAEPRSRRIERQPTLRELAA